MPPEESTRSIECCNFDGTKSNYLFDQVNKWSVLEDLESRLEIKEERQTSWHFPTLTILWIRDPSRRESFSVFFPESHRQLRDYFYFSPSIDVLKIHPFSLLGSSCFAQDVVHRLRREYFSLGCISQTVSLHKMQAQTGGPI